jgi:transposase-like protein
MNAPRLGYAGYRFPPEIISHAVWLYHRFCLSFRDAEDLLAQRGITISHETVLASVTVDRSPLSA